MIEFDDSLRERLIANLAAHEIAAIEPDDLHRAAVAIVVVGS
ncbi:MAG: hypothetical protein QOJ74_920, partial [Ilumatobacteraceae bacterium]|nr:hypothetical protein [Ilumatobacteraceae bacterium]